MGPEPRPPVPPHRVGEVAGRGAFSVFRRVDCTGSPLADAPPRHVRIDEGMGGKRLELLKQIAPAVTRVGILRDATQGGGTSLFAAMQTVAPSLKVEVNPINMRDGGEIERAIAAFAGSPNGGLIVAASATGEFNRELILSLATQYKLPAIYFQRAFVIRGGLVSYGVEQHDQYRKAAGYVDRILKGEKPADLPVQAPTKFDLVVNLKTAKALGLTIPETLIATADEVIQ